MVTQKEKNATFYVCFIHVVEFLWDFIRQYNLMFKQAIVNLLLNATFHSIGVHKKYCRLKLAKLFRITIKLVLIK